MTMGKLTGSLWDAPINCGVWDTAQFWPSALRRHLKADFVTHTVIGFEDLIGGVHDGSYQAAVVEWCEIHHCKSFAKLAELTDRVPIWCVSRVDRSASPKALNFDLPHSTSESVELSWNSPLFWKQLGFVDFFPNLLHVDRLVRSINRIRVADPGGSLEDRIYCALPWKSIKR